MTWQENIRRWQALPAERKLQIRWEAIVRDVAESMAFENEPVSEERIRATLDQIEPPASSGPPTTASATANEHERRSRPMSETPLIKAPPKQVSTQVRMHLEMAGEQLRVHQLGLDFAIVETTEAYLPGAARLFVQVDDALTVRDVFLPEGIRPDTLRTRLMPA